VSDHPWAGKPPPPADWPLCPACDGWGIDTLHDERAGRTDHVWCPACDGRGRVPPPEVDPGTHGGQAP
jgi:hypothetical protein